MKSMTGYGKGEAAAKERRMTVEIKTVNNRYLETNVRLPKALSSVEETIKRVIREAISRGSAEVYVSYANGSDSAKKITVDRAMINAYLAAADEIKSLTGGRLPYDITLSSLMKMSDVLGVEQAEEDESLLRSLAEEATGKAVAALVEMRRVEGETIKADLCKLAGNIENALLGVEERAPLVVKSYEEKLRARMVELLGGVEVDEARLLNEVAFFADKADINEEIQRLRSHLMQFRAAIEAATPQGRNLDFISQEMGREINTMGSKSNDGELTKKVVYMKNELEKIKEQIRNVE